MTTPHRIFPTIAAALSLLLLSTPSWAGFKLYLAKGDSGSVKSAASASCSGTKIFASKTHIHTVSNLFGGSARDCRDGARGLAQHLILSGEKIRLYNGLLGTNLATKGGVVFHAIKANDYGFSKPKFYKCSGNDFRAALGRYKKCFAKCKKKWNKKATCGHKTKKSLTCREILNIGKVGLPKYLEEYEGFQELDIGVLAKDWVRLGERIREEKQ